MNENKYFKSINICSHSVAAAEKSGDLISFIKWHQLQNRFQPNLTELGRHGMPAGAGRKGGKTAKRRKCRLLNQLQMKTGFHLARLYPLKVKVTVLLFSPLATILRQHLSLPVPRVLMIGNQLIHLVLEIGKRTMLVLPLQRTHLL